MRWISAVAAALLIFQSTPVFAQDARTDLANGDKAARAKDWQKALDAYSSANKATPSADAQEGVASAEYELKHDAEAYTAYEDLLKTYGTKLPAGKKQNADNRLKEISGRTGLLDLQATEPGAAISIDEKPMGTTPLAKPLRLPAGPHRVRITKDGFQPFDQVPAVAVGTTATVVVKLEAASTKGKIVVKEKSGQPIRVLVDGIDVGDAPWTGDVEAGQHEIGGRSPSMIAVSQRVVVERGKTNNVEIVASSSTALLKITINDGKGNIYLDDALVGEGGFSKEVPSGPHKIKVKREGYDTFEADIVLREKEPYVQAVTLSLGSQVSTGKIEKEKGQLQGVYGGFGLLFSTQPGGMKSSIQKLCTAGDKPQELTGCDEGNGIGAGLTGFVGYHWDPVGVELFAAFQYDQASPKYTWAAASTDPGIGPDPARTEEFSLHRFGGLGAFRIRYTLQGEKIRFSIAGGVGLSLRSIILTRDTTATPPGLGRNAFVPGGESYLSPVLSLEPTIQYRITNGISAQLGLALLVESPNAFNQIPTTKSDGTQTLGAGGLTTPSYELATQTQIYLGPFIGMMFGP